MYYLSADFFLFKKLERRYNEIGRIRESQRSLTAEKSNSDRVRKEVKEGRGREEGSDVCSLMKRRDKKQPPR